MINRIYKKIIRILYDRNPVNLILGRIIYGNDCGLRMNYIGSKKLENNFNQKHSFGDKEKVSFFTENGYIKLDHIINKDIILKIKDKFEKKISEEGNFEKDLRFDFSSLNNPDFFSDFSEVKEIIDDKIINIIQAYYNTYLNISNVHVYRIKRDLKNDPKDLSTYGSTIGWHNDGSPIDTVKIFFSLNKLDENDGPMEFLSSKDTKKIFRSSPFFTSKKKLMNQIKDFKKMTFDGHEAYIINTNHCLHRASRPKRDHRDLLVFVCNSTNQESSFNWEIDSSINIYNV